jgi:hypothetical protein
MYNFTPYSGEGAISCHDWLRMRVQLLAGRRNVYLAGLYLTGPFGLDEGGVRTLHAYYYGCQEDLSDFLYIFHRSYFDLKSQRWTCHNKSACAVSLARGLWPSRKDGIPMDSVLWDLEH